MDEDGGRRCAQARLHDAAGIHNEDGDAVKEWAPVALQERAVARPEGDGLDAIIEPPISLDSDLG